MTDVVRILSGGAAHGLVEAHRVAFEAETGCRIEGTFGAVGAMKAKLLAGEPTDLVIFTDAMVRDLAAEGLVGAGTDIGTVAASVAVRTGDPVPDIGDADALKAALLAADAIHLPDPQAATAGIHFAAVLKRLGIDRTVADGLRPFPNGATAMAALARSEAKRPIGSTQATEILSTPGVTLVGPLPPGCDLATTYTAAVCRDAGNLGAAEALITRLSADEHAGLREEAGFHRHRTPRSHSGRSEAELRNPRPG